jgi:hypothetical protein
MTVVPRQANKCCCRTRKNWNRITRGHSTVCDVPNTITQWTWNVHYYIGTALDDSMDMVSSILSFRSIFAIFISMSGYTDFAHLDSLSVRNYDYSSSRIAPGGDSTTLVWVSSVSGGVWTGPTDPTLASSFTSAAATVACRRPSSTSLCVKRAISESYSSHSGIFRARASFGSFCVRV